MSQLAILRLEVAVAEALLQHPDVCLSPPLFFEKSTPRKRETRRNRFRWFSMFGKALRKPGTGTFETAPVEPTRLLAARGSFAGWIRSCGVRSCQKKTVWPLSRCSSFLSVIFERPPCEPADSKIPTNVRPSDEVPSAANSRGAACAAKDRLQRCSFFAPVGRRRICVT